MNIKDFEYFGLFCFSALCFGLGTLLAGGLISHDDEDCIFPAAWLVGTIVFATAMVVAYG